MDTKQKKKNIVFLDWFNAIVYAFIIVMLFFTFIFRTVSVDGTSMVPTLQNGDRLFARSLFYKPKQGDIVAIDAYIPYGRSLIKRVIATGGDTIEIDVKSQQVIVNNEVLQEDYIANAIFSLDDVEFPLIVPEGKVFLMGDNRNFSTDSRNTVIGFIDERDILGKIIFRFLPFKDMKVF